MKNNLKFYRTMRGVSRSCGSARVRAKTFYGIASAMALQWG